MSYGNKQSKILGLFTEYMYSRGGGEEFMLDLAFHFKRRGMDVVWFYMYPSDTPISLVDLSANGFRSSDSYREICLLTEEVKSKGKWRNNPCLMVDIILFELKKYNIDYLLHQGRGHGIVSEVAKRSLVPVITFWCFWEEAIGFDRGGRQRHRKIESFEDTIRNVDYFYFASKFMRDLVQSKYEMALSDDHVFLTLPFNSRSDRNTERSSFHSQYVTLLNCHVSKGGVIFSKLVDLIPELDFLAIQIDTEPTGPEAIEASFARVNNKNNRLLSQRVNKIGTVYDITKILLCPTLLEETFCRVVFEGFKNGIPVVFSGRGNLDSIIGPHLLKVNMACEEAYLAEFKELIDRLTSDEAFYDDVVSAQQNYYAEQCGEYSMDTVYDKLLDIERTKQDAKLN